MRDGVHQVGLAQARRSMDEERVVVVAGLLGDGERGAMGHLVLRADDEVLESIGGLDRRSRRSGGLTRSTGDRSGRRSDLAGGVDGSRQAIVHAATGDQGELTTEHLRVVAVDPGFGEDRRSFQDEDFAFDDAQRLQGRDPGFVVGARQGVTEFAFGGFPKGEVADGRGHEKGGGLRKVVHRLFGSPKVRYFCKTIVKETGSTVWLLLCQTEHMNEVRRKSLMKCGLEG